MEHEDIPEFSFCISPLSGEAGSGTGGRKEQLRDRAHDKQG